ncbi:MAG: HAMP domain-containing sensor histidine kinase [Planctomycetota bacterium]
MQSVPSELASVLLPLALGQRRFAYLRTDDAGRVQASGGDLAALALARPEPGTELGQVADFLVGLDAPLSGASTLPRVQLPGGAFVDVHQIAEPGGGTVVLLVDVTDDAERYRLIQQEHNAAVLASARGEDATDAGVIGEVLTSMAAIAVEEVRGGRLRRIAGWPFWIEAVLGPQATGGETFDGGDVVPFLENFLHDAREQWDSGRSGRLHSGIWMEQIGELELALEATALLLAGGRRVLVVRSQEDTAHEKRRLLQKARETTLEFRRTQREIEKKEILLGCIVHDLKGPLAGMMGALSLLERGVSPERETQMVELGLRQARLQREMIQDVLDLFSADLAEVDPAAGSAGSTDLAGCAREALDGQSTALEERQLGSSLDVGDLAPGTCVAGNADRLRRVFFNLIENAIRHSPAGGAVEIALSRSDEGARAQVLDRGPGVPEDKVERIFRPRSRSGPNAGSAGLGLYYCATTVQRWGGKIGYAAREGGGAAFWFELPEAPTPAG